jgi:hypothetical protein
MKKEDSHRVDLKEGSFLIGVEPHEADFILTREGSLEKITTRSPLIDYRIVIHTDSGQKYLEYEILDYGRKTA